MKIIYTNTPQVRGAVGACKFGDPRTPRVARLKGTGGLEDTVLTRGCECVPSLFLDLCDGNVESVERGSATYSVPAYRGSIDCL